MSGGIKCLEPTPYDIQMMLACQVHMGTKNVDKDMEKYVFKRKNDGTNIINVAKTWEKLVLAARVIVTIENAQDVCAISEPEYGRRAVLKYAHYTGCRYLAGRFTPGSFTNQIQKNFIEPRILIVTDPLNDHQAIKEASYVNIPVIAFCDTDTPLKHVDIAIPCNNKGRQSIALMYWMLAREVLRMKDSISRKKPWEVKLDLFFYRDPEKEVDKKKDKEKEEDKQQQQQQQSVVAMDLSQPQTQPQTQGGETKNWGGEGDEEGNEQPGFEPLSNQENAQIMKQQQQPTTTTTTTTTQQQPPQTQTSTDNYFQ